LSVVAIIQARMGSTRLPGKVLEDICERPMLGRVLDRTGISNSIDEIIVATTTNPIDDIIEQFCSEESCKCFRGDEEDVLDRYYQAIQQSGAKNIVRITSDCPLVDPGVIDLVIQAFLDARPDYASNIIPPRTFPRGLDVEVFTKDTLVNAWENCDKAAWREHVTPYIYSNPDLFNILPVRNEEDYSDYRWTVDTPEDLTLVREIYSLVEGPFNWMDVMNLFIEHPQLKTMNQEVRQKEVRLWQ